RNCCAPSSCRSNSRATATAPAIRPTRPEPRDRPHQGLECGSGVSVRPGSRRAGDSPAIIRRTQMTFRKSRAPPEPDRRADLETVRQAAVALLARRDFASSELREKLAAQGYDPDITAGVVTELIGRHVLDDGRYAENYVAYHSKRGQGPVRIAADLRALGVPAELIEAALAVGPDWRALAQEVRRRKFGPEPPENWSEKA